MSASAGGAANAAVEIARLAMMDDFEYKRARKEAALRLGVPLKTLDTQVAAAKEAHRKSQAPGDWKNQLHRTATGRPRATLLNAAIALRNAPEWKGRLYYCLFSNNVVVDDIAMRDVDAAKLAAWLQERDIDITPAVAHDAMVLVAHDTLRHPVREYLDGIAWDGVERIGGWLIDHLGAENSALNRAFGRKFLIAAVARVMQPGCKVDTVLVLEGTQKIGKSTSARTLAGDNWFTDHGSEISTKDSKQELSGIWIKEIAEFSALRRADVESVKSFLSTQVDRYRKPYGRIPEPVPRQCVFIATLNPGEAGYLKDATGARRFWPVECCVGWPAARKIDVRRLAAVRDQMWAEALHAYRLGESWWLDSAEEAEQAVAADDRFDVDAWEERVAAFLDTVEPDAKGVVSVSTGEILTGALHKAAEHWTRADQTRVGAIMLRMAGWTKRQLRENGIPTRRYYRAASSSSQPAPLSPPIDDLMG